MNEGLTDRLNKILPRLASDDLLSGSGIGNEIAFYIFDYPPEDELRVREHIRFLETTTDVEDFLDSLRTELEQAIGQHQRVEIR